MRAFFVVLAVCAATGACKSSEQPEPPGRSAYGPVTAQTSITVSISVVSDIMRPGCCDRRIQITGDGTLRDEDSGRTHMGHASQAQLVRVLNELAQLDFLNIQCSGSYGLDHGAFPSVHLVVPAGKRSVRLDDCTNHYPALRNVVDDVEKLAHEATR